MITKKEIGKIGEELAVQYLEKQGYCIEEKNYRTSIGEIDIIASIKNELVFVEVKTRTTLNFGDPIESIDIKKIKRIQRVGAEYKYSRGLIDAESRIDVFEILLQHHQDI